MNVIMCSFGVIVVFVVLLELLVESVVGLFLELFAVYIRVCRVIPWFIKG